MDLKDFIKETISSIVESTRELQSKYEEERILVNPPVSNTESEFYEDDSPRHILRRIELVEFDVALTTSSETTGGGKAAIKVFSAEAGGKGAHTRANEQVSRVRFKIPVTLSPSSAEGRGRAARDKQNQHTKDALQGHLRGPSV